MNSELISRKITVLSVIAMVSVVYIHSNTIGTSPSASEWNLVLQAFLTRGVSGWAVPFFFVVSGFWFARSRYVTENGGGYQKFIFKKMRTLLMPYLCWSVIGAAIVFPLIAFNNYVNHLPIGNRTILGAAGIFAKANHLIGITSNGPSGNLALWYVRTLIIFFAVAPLWKPIVRISHYLPLVLGLGLVLVGPDTWIPSTGLKTGSFGWLLLGMGAAPWIVENRKLPRWAAWMSGFLWVGLALLKSFGFLTAVPLIPIFGILFFWSVSDWDIPIRPWMKQTFWIYCLHGAMIGYLIAGIPYALGKSDGVTFATMLVSPWLAIVICLFAANVIRRFMPRVYDVLVGGRG